MKWNKRQRHDRQSARKGKQTKQAKARRARKAICGGCRQQRLVSKAERHTQLVAEFDHRVSELLAALPECVGFRQIVPITPYLALPTEARYDRIRRYLEKGREEALKREAPVLGEGQYHVTSH